PFESREIPWLGGSSSLAWGIEGQRRQVIMTLDEVDRLCIEPATVKPMEDMHGGDGAEDWSQGHRFGNPRRVVSCRGRQRQHEVETSASPYEPLQFERRRHFQDREGASDVERKDRPAKSMAVTPRLLRE